MKRFQNKIQAKSTGGNSNTGNNFLERNGKQQHPLEHPLPGTLRLQHIKHRQLHVGKPLESSAFPANHCIKTLGSPKLEASPKGQFAKSRWCSLLSASGASAIRSEKGEKFGFSQVFLYLIPLSNATNAEPRFP